MEQIPRCNRPARTTAALIDGRLKLRAQRNFSKRTEPNIGRIRRNSARFTSYFQNKSWAVCIFHKINKFRSNTPEIRPLVCHNRIEPRTERQIEASRAKRSQIPRARNARGQAQLHPSEGAARKGRALRSVAARFGREGNAPQDAKLTLLRRPPRVGGVRALRGMGKRRQTWQLGGADSAGLVDRLFS